MSQTLFTSQTPAVPDISDGSAYSMGTYFTAGVNGQILGLRWYYPTNLQPGGNPVKAALFRNSDQVKLSGGTDVSMPSPGTLGAWNTVTFAAPVNVVAGTLYCATILTPGRYVSSTGGLSPWPLTNLDLSTPANAGRFTATVSGVVEFPTTQFNNGCYFIDPIFEPAGGGTTPVTSTLRVKWNVFAGVTSTLRAKWNVRTRVTSTLRVKWAVEADPVIVVPIENTRYLNTQRRMTEKFIADDPTTAVLIPSVRSKTTSGGYSYVDGVARDAQTFKLSLLSYDQRPTVTVAGVERLVDYHLIGKHDMQIAVGDYWVDADGTRYDVGGFSEGWSYMTKAFVVRTVPRGVKI